MQPDDQQSYQDPPMQNEQPSGPITTLSPDEQQPPEQNQAPIPGDHSAEVAEPVRWQAAEYIQREKDPTWFAAFLAVTVGFILLAIFVIKSFTFAILVPVMAAALFIYTRRPPRVLDYTLSRQGLFINDQLFPFGEFKSFALVHGFEQYSIMLIPTKRFKPAVTINFPQEAGEAIVDMLAARLPMKEVQLDTVDRIIKKLHL